MEEQIHEKTLLIIVSVLVVVVLGICINSFVIGEPIDGAQVNCTISEHANNLELQVTAIESAVALKGWKLDQKGTTLYISARKVLVSPLFSEGRYETLIDLKGVEQILFGGQVIWSKQN
ncbi:MAG: hypothetical protein RR146_09965 [Lachnospiraceae bacterium]